LKIFKVKQKESKTLFLAVTHGGSVLNLTDSTLTLQVYDKNKILKIEKIDSDFDKTEAVVGEVTVLLNGTDLDLTPDIYNGYMKIIIGTLIDKTIEFNLIVKNSPI
jgi:hypothetical protein